MEIQLKQRLIGAIVVFTLLIIFLPMVFQNNSDQEYVEQILEPPIPQDIKDKKIIIDQEQKSPDGLIEEQLTELPPEKIEEQPYKPSSLSDESDSDMDDFALQADNQISPKSTNNSDTKLIEKPSEIKAEAASESASTKNTIAPVDANVAQATVLPIEAKSTVANTNPNKLALQMQNLPRADSNSAVEFKVSSDIAKGQVFAVKIGSFRNHSTASAEKNKLLAIGLPAYIYKNANRYDLFVGPELEFKYIKELALRIKNETNYKAEVLAHDARWVTE